MDRPEPRLEDLAAELRATEELPVERSAARWIGEAEAVAVDIAQGDPDADTIARRVGHVAELLENVDGTGHPDADERVAAARATAADILDQCCE